MVWRVIHSWGWTLSALAIVGGWWMVQTFPRAGHWMRVEPTVIFDAPKGASVIMDVRRQIRRPFNANWNVLVRRWDGKGWEIICAAQGSSDYLPDSVLPSPLTLDWWTEGKCGSPPAGRLMVSTVWTLHTGLPGVRQVTSQSNVFEVTP